MWEDLTVLLAGLGFTVAFVVFVIELAALVARTRLTGPPWRSTREPRHHIARKDRSHEAR